MRRLIDAMILWCLICGVAFGQASNPQNTFANALNADRPSVWLNFNDPTTAFKDQVSQARFVNTETVTTTVTHSPTPPAAAPNGQTYFGAFNGTNDYLSTTTSTLNPAAYSFSAWVYLSAIPASGNYVSILSQGATGFTTMLVTSSGTIFAGITTTAANTTTDVSYTGTHVLAANTWYFVSMTYDSVAGLNGYVNGVLDGSAAANGTAADNTGVFEIGGNYPCCGGRYLNGQISDVSIYNVALTSAQVNTLYTGGSITSGLIGQWNINEGTGTTAVDSSTGGNNLTWAGTASGNFGYYWGPATTTTTTTYTSGTVTPQQPGFDNTNAQQLSAEFPYNGFNAAPNNTVGSIEWDVPWTMLVHVDRLNWDRTGALVLASKGQGNPGWKLVLQPNAGNTNASQLCFFRDGTGSNYASQQVCTASNYDAMPNGFDYDIVVEDSGTGDGGGNEAGTPALSLWINGLPVGTAASNSYSTGFGNAVWTINAGGSGYAATTNFTSTGGGANCVVTGVASATSGVITSVTSPTGYSNSGCTSAPTIVLASPTGTGANITATVAPMSMNSTTDPLMVPGYRSGGAYFGVGGTDATQNPVYVDEYAIFPGNLTSAQIANLFYTAKFYQTTVDSATPQPVVILEDDTFVDPDNEFTLETTIALHRAGLITLAGVVVEDYTPAGVAAWRQMLDAAGLNDVPVSIPNVSPGTSGYGTVNVTAYNASTPLTLSAWGDSTAMYRSVFAKYPTRPIKIIQGSPYYYALATFMQSPADSISSLTGLQMVTQNAANGGALYVQGSVWDTSANGAYVVQNLQGMPLYAIGGTPMSAGPGTLVTRTSNDPPYLYFKGIGSDTRQCYDCLTIESIVSSLFDFGVQVTYSGGTGYANATPFALSGGGPHCQGSGIMTAASGIPNGIEFGWGQSAVGSSSGIGSGCTSVPTVNLVGATGTGVTLTATPSPCGTFVPTPSGSTYSYTFSTATCSNQYSTPGSFNTNQSPVSGAVMTWFINSLVDAPPGGAPRTP